MSSTWQLHGTHMEETPNMGWSTWDFTWLHICGVTINLHQISNSPKRMDVSHRMQLSSTYRNSYFETIRHSCQRTRPMDIQIVSLLIMAEWWWAQVKGNWKSGLKTPLQGLWAGLRPSHESSIMPPHLSASLCCTGRRIYIHVYSWCQLIKHIFYGSVSIVSLVCPFLNCFYRLPCTVWSFRLS